MLLCINRFVDAKHRELNSMRQPSQVSKRIFAEYHPLITNIDTDRIINLKSKLNHSLSMRYFYIILTTWLFQNILWKIISFSAYKTRSIIFMVNVTIKCTVMWIFLGFLDAHKNWLQIGSSNILTKPELILFVILSFF